MLSGTWLQLPNALNGACQSMIPTAGETPKSIEPKSRLLFCCYTFIYTA